MTKIATALSAAMAKPVHIISRSGKVEKQKIPLAWSVKDPK